ncbi:unnamed protein product [Ilex paraguariensis]|uniref:Uncharacterized protein n=1 Tax=Ilex paraguariensis TaxID=185542 RepID=A0ABC8SWF5_9AQUA
MPRDALHHGGVEHRELHNAYGYYFHMATADGLVKRGDGKNRPFVLSRAFFPGSQRYGAVWTGDNSADWDQLKVSVPMVLTLGLTGVSFSGADVGGFFGNPEPELLVRWYQLGAYYPFFRGHAHHDTKRREPWLFGRGGLYRHPTYRVWGCFTHLDERVVRNLGSDSSGPENSALFKAENSIRQQYFGAGGATLWVMVQWIVWKKEERNTELMREAIRVRYMLLPYFYTLFREANVSGVPVVRPLWMEFPADEATFSNDEAFMVGNSILVQGIYTEVLLQPDGRFVFVCCNQISSAFFFSLVTCFVSSLFLSQTKCISNFQAGCQTCVSVSPGGQIWYDLKTGTSYKGEMTHKLVVSEESVPAFQRAGTIIPRKDRFRRSSTQMENDPYTLVCVRFSSASFLAHSPACNPAGPPFQIISAPFCVLEEAVWLLQGPI